MSKSHKALTTQWLSFLQKKPENQTCCDCPARSPGWAFLLKNPIAPKDDEEDRIGAFICYTCSCAHKKLNEPLGSIKSVALGSWTTADIRAMSRGGNQIMNQVFEPNLSQQNLKPTESSDETERSLFLQLKYGQRKFYCPSAASKLIQPPNPLIESPNPSNDSGHSKRTNLSSHRQMSLPTILSPRTPSQSLSGRVSREQSEGDWQILSPTSTSAYSMSMSTISTKSTLYAGGRSNHNRIEIIKETSAGGGGGSSTQRLHNLSLDSFIEANNDSSDEQHRKRNRAAAPLVESSQESSRPLREFHLEDDDKDTRPKMCRRMNSSSTLHDGHSDARSRQSGRRTKSLDTDPDLQKLVEEHDEEQEQLITRVEYGPAHRRSSMGSEQRPPSVEPSGRRRGSMGGRRTSSVERLQRRTISIDSQQGKQRASLSRRNLSVDSQSSTTNRRSQQRRNSTTGSSEQRERPKYTRGLSAFSIMKRRSSVDNRPQEEAERPKYTRGFSTSSIMRRNSVGNNPQGAERPKDRRGFSSSSIMRRNSVDNNPQGAERTKDTKRLSSSSIMRRNSVDNNPQRAERPKYRLSSSSMGRNSMAGSAATPSWGHRSDPSLLDFSDHDMPTPQTMMDGSTTTHWGHQSDPSILDFSDNYDSLQGGHESLTEGPTPRMTGRRKSIGVDRVPSQRRNSLTGGKNPMDRSLSRDPANRKARRDSLWGSQRSQNDPSPLKPRRDSLSCSQRSQGSLSLKDSSATRKPRRNSLMGSQRSQGALSPSTNTSARKPHRDVLSGSQRSQGSLVASNHGVGSNVLRRGRSKRNFSRQGSSKNNNADLKKEEQSEDGSPNQSVASVSSHRLRQGLISGEKRSSARGLGSLRSSLGARRQSNDSDLTSSKLASTQSTKPTASPNHNDLASELDRIDKETMRNEEKSPSSPLTVSTASKRVPRSLHVVLCADSDENRTFVSNITAESSVHSNWSLHNERWKA